MFDTPSHANAQHAVNREETRKNEIHKRQAVDIQRVNVHFQHANSRRQRWTSSVDAFDVHAE